MDLLPVGGLEDPSEAGYVGFAQLDTEFIQVLQDMIGVLTGAPEPVVVKLFSQEPELLYEWAPQVAEALAGITIDGKNPVVDIEDGVENKTSGPALMFTLRRRPVRASPVKNSAS